MERSDKDIFSPVVCFLILPEATVENYFKVVEEEGSGSY